MALGQPRLKALAPRVFLKCYNITIRVRQTDNRGVHEMPRDGMLIVVHVSGCMTLKIKRSWVEKQDEDRPGLAPRVRGPGRSKPGRQSEKTRIYHPL